MKNTPSISGNKTPGIAPDYAVRSQRSRLRFILPAVKKVGSMANVTALVSQPQPSDASLKENVRSMEPVLPRLTKLRFNDE